MYFLGVDPGKMTGVAVLSTPPTSTTPAHSALELPANLVLEWVTGFLEPVMSSDCVIGIERYTVTGSTHKKTRQRDALELDAQLTSYALGREIPVVHVGAALSKTYTDRWLRRVGWRVPTKDGHADDASRVLATTLMTCQPRVLQQIIVESSRA